MNKNKDTFLREIIINNDKVQDKNLSLFEGSIKKDKEYWEKYHKTISIRYFKLQEVKNEKKSV